MTRAARSMLLVVLFLGVVSTMPAGDAEYAVTVTNLTRGQVFTPLLVATHNPGVRLFTPGQPASVELEILAESGNTTLLAALLGMQGEVAGSGALPPGQSVTVYVDGTGSADRISLAAMLVPTNDAFVALNSVPAPSGNETSMFVAYAWDAGTEANDELCASIPGPPSVCKGGEGFNPSREGAEGYVHIHAGIHGISDLRDADRDWRNPVARVVVTRTAGGIGDDEGDDEDDDED